MPRGDVWADFNPLSGTGGTQFWSGDVNHCTIPGCESEIVVVTLPVTVTVEDTNGVPKDGVPVYVFDGSTYTEFTGTTDVNGEVTLTLPEGSYRFRADYSGTQFWSGAANHCAVPGCSVATVQVTLPVTVTVEDTDNTPKEGVPVYVFDGATYTYYNDTTDSNGEVSFTLPPGSNRFRADYEDVQFWSDDVNHCDIPGCENAIVVVPLPVVSVEDTEGTPKEGVNVYVFDGSTYTEFTDATDINGEVSFTLPMGDYRFRADYDGVQFWSDIVNHCTIPGCVAATVVVTLLVTVTVEDGGGSPLDGVPVYVFNGLTYTGINDTTNIDGEVDFTLLQGSYRFRADYNDEQFWSSEENHCDIPGCEAVMIVAGAAATTTQTPTETPEPSPTAEDTPTPNPTPTDTPEPTNTPEPTPTESASLGGIGVLAMVRPAPIELPLLDPDAVTVAVEDTNGDPKEGLPVNVFDGVSYTGYNDITNASGEVAFDLPEGSYRFRSDLNGTQFWSGETNHCDIPGCFNAAVVVTIPVTVTVEDTDGTLKDGLPVYAFDGTTYTGYNGTTDANGEVVLTLPQGDYRFRSDLNGMHFWSDEINHCTIPGCESATIVVTLPVTVYVENTDAVPQEGPPVYVFDEATYTGFNGTTDVNGEVALTLPQGDYRFRSDLNGTQFWSGETNHCTIPGCLNASITVTIPMAVTVQSQTGSPYPDLPVYAFDGETYTGFNGTSDANGQVVFTLPVGDYRFRTDYDGVQFWSGEANHCTIPGCLEALVEIPGGVGEVSVTIDYTYDSLYRLTTADYDTGEFFHYTYDAVGNRLTQETHEETNAYVYDIANRLIEVDGVTFVWDNNGNLIQDDTRIYGYDYANRLTFVLMDGDTYNFSYNGLGDRLRQTVNGVPTNYSLDINRGLTQVLTDDTSAYLYGLHRIGKVGGIDWSYYQGDAIGSVRQLIDSNSDATMAQSFEPFGAILSIIGDETTNYGFTGEWTDDTGLVHLRARYYAVQGRFLTRDEWNGDPDRPSSYNEWLYAYANPVLYVDASGHAAQARPCTKGGFCQLDDVRWGGIVIDGPHFFSSMKIAEGIIGQLDLNIGRDSAPLTVSEINIRFPETKFGIEVSKEGLYEFGRNYLTSLPKGISGPTIRSIGLGIFMNFQLSLETFQAWVDPRCDRRIPGHCSGFSNEDLPSDYLGYIAVAMFGKSSANPNSINDIVGELGGGHAVESRDPIYKGDWLDAWRCSRLGLCDENNPYNACFTAKIFDKVRRAFVHVPWPEVVVMDPIGQGEYWKVIPGFSLRIFPLRDE